MKEPLYPYIEITPVASYTIDALLRQIDNFERKIGRDQLNLRPDYQRAEAWNVDFKEKLVYSLVTNYPIGNFIFRTLRNIESSESIYEVVDGQQRLLTIRELLKGALELSPSISRLIMQENARFYEYDIENGLNREGCQLYKKYINDNKANVKLRFSSLPTLIQSQIQGYQLGVIKVSCNDETIRQYFRFVQNQERLRAGEIINAIPDSPIHKYMDKIQDKDTFLKKIGWNESRKEFDKIFYSMAGIFNNELNFGTTDENIINYVTNFTLLDESADEKMNLLIESINAISKSECSNSGKFSKRLIKYFMLSSGFGFINFLSNTEIAFDIMLNIESKLPHFNSGDSKKINKIFNNYPQNIVDDYYKIFILGRGSHSPKSTYEILSKIKNIFEYELKIYSNKKI